MKHASTSIRQQVRVCIGRSDEPVGTLVYARQGRRENSAFAYEQSWLAHDAHFNVSADLRLALGYQPHKARHAVDSVFHGAIADTAPDAWGRRVVARDHANRRKDNAELAALSEMDYLLAVDDFSRVGALRFCDEGGQWQRTVDVGRRRTPPLVDLGIVYRASRALELGEETVADLKFLQGKGTSLGGMRPKCTMLDETGRLAIGKFPSIGDTRSVTRGEVLALKLASLAGVDAAHAHIVEVEKTPIAVIRRFDRGDADDRIPYQSAATMLQASREEDRSYTEIVDVIRACGYAPTGDLHQLWRRLVFNLLITNVDDHLQNLGFLHVSGGLWRLAPAFDVNPFPDKERESKTWLSEQDGPITDISTLVARANEFALEREQSLQILAQVCAAVKNWRHVATDPVVGLFGRELDDFAPAFEHEQLRLAVGLIT